MDLRQCPCSGKTLARLLQPAVMAVLAKGPLHGYRILQELKSHAMFAGQGPDTTGLYRLLRAMEKQTLVSSTWDTTAAGPAKRHYELTATGRDCLAQWIRTLRDYQESVAALLALAASADQSARRRARTVAKRCACKATTAAAKRRRAP